MPVIAAARASGIPYFAKYRPKLASGIVTSRPSSHLMLYSFGDWFTTVIVKLPIDSLVVEIVEAILYMLQSPGEKIVILRNLRYDAWLVAFE